MKVVWSLRNEIQPRMEFLNRSFYQRFFRRNQKVISDFLIFIFYFIISGILARYFGGLLKSPDSIGYEQFSVEPWRLIGDWHPPGPSYILFLGAKFGMSSFTCYQILASLLCFSFYKILELKTNWKWAFFWSFLFFLEPAWMVLRMTLWSELPFVLGFALVGLFLSMRNLSLVIKGGVVILLTLVTLQFRLAGIFFFPAIIIALGQRWKGNKWIFHYRQSALWGAALLMGWMLMNFAVTGHPFQSSRKIGNAASCRSVLVSLNQFPYCDWNPSLEICSYDPERKVIGNPLLSQDDAALVQLQDSSLIMMYKIEHPESICGVQQKVMGLIMAHAPFKFMGLVLHRIWNHFGLWGFTERSSPRPGFGHMDRIVLLDDYLEYANHPQHFIQVLLIVVSLAIFLIPGFRNEMIYFWLAAVGHAAGISLVNPFLALRYEAVSKFFLFLCIGYFIFWNKKSLKNSRPIHRKANL